MSNCYNCQLLCRTYASRLLVTFIAWPLLAPPGTMQPSIHPPHTPISLLPLKKYHDKKRDPQASIWIHMVFEPTIGLTYECVWCWWFWMNLSESQWVGFLTWRGRGALRLNFVPHRISIVRRLNSTHMITWRRMNSENNESRKKDFGKKNGVFLSSRCFQYISQNAFRQTKTLVTATFASLDVILGTW